MIHVEFKVELRREEHSGGCQDLAEVEDAWGRGN